MLDTENRTSFNGNKSRLENLELLDQIYQDALWVFEDAGIKCDLPEVRRIFEVTETVTFDESIGHLYVLESFVEQSLTTTPKQAHYWIPRYSFGVGGTPPFVFDDLIKEGIQLPVKHSARVRQRMAGCVETFHKYIITIFNFIKKNDLRYLLTRRVENGSRHMPEL